MTGHGKKTRSMSVSQRHSSIPKPGSFEKQHKKDFKQAQNISKQRFQLVEFEASTMTRPAASAAAARQ